MRIGKGVIKMKKKLAALAAAGAILLSAAAVFAIGPAEPAQVNDFYTNALDADGNFRSVLCTHAQQVAKGGKFKETYACEFVSDAFWGDPVLPTRAMRWDYESSTNLVDVTITGLKGPYRWFSDVQDILSDDLCWMYTNDWTMVITPSGKVNITVVYDQPVFEGPECTN